MDAAMRGRFVEGLEAKGITKGNWAESSVAVKKPDGRRLGKTFLRDAVMRGKGKDEYVQWVCAHYGISWDYVKFNRGNKPLLASEGHRASRPVSGTIDPTRLIDAIEGACKMLGASQQRAARMAREALAISQGHELE